MQILFHSLTVKISENCAYLEGEITFKEWKTIGNFIVAKY